MVVELEVASKVKIFTAEPQSNYARELQRVKFSAITLRHFAYSPRNSALNFFAEAFKTSIF